MADHSDPEFYSKYEFCRTDCEECDRLDRIDLDKGMTKQEVRAIGAAKVMDAAIGEGFLLPEGQTWEQAVAHAIAEMEQERQR